MTADLDSVVGHPVSRETIERLEHHVVLLKKWSPKINLVAPGTLADAWQRHVLDSAQLFRLIPEGARSYLDVGSGAGFPGLVVAALAKELLPKLEITLVESDQRKCAFLRSVSRETDLGVTVLSKRIEKLAPVQSDVISARAVADLTSLLDITDLHLKPDGLALFSKGESWQNEVLAAQAKWRFRYEAHASITKKNAVILAIHELSHV
ncbi:16S rRNA (guanine(527)-N(7))-methyltransferase RsmG [Aestuariicoccus sp. MJ-SS9]|uniref:16S rRNA (guanine(527)-N(7))-methyltransferase RsmG n=1 Tax=Aestuariicoccus sp. MJ-SS9 TaxID=3079855 RepID=UPI0029068D81|nr:16S rRNA (guanine(527)-N(7))-methyltransferase RsmG [Aestuariicoccus sp. MJ-SS9]MDU8910908.1 16S rRNA (guanine(527)-N(7))-methyltransferase RsmG [Aestuariicoccus sp. MJ-SS9]